MIPEKYITKLITRSSNSEEVAISLDDAIKYVRVELVKVSNMAKFSRENNLCYNNIVSIKNNKQPERYPNIIKSLLFIFYKIDADSITYFKSKVPDKIK